MRVIQKLFRKDDYDPKFFDEQINGINELRLFVAQDKYIAMLFKALINPVLIPPDPNLTFNRKTPTSKTKTPTQFYVRYSNSSTKMNSKMTFNCRYNSK
jgi:hypothetical protein